MRKSIFFLLIIFLVSLFSFARDASTQAAGGSQQKTRDTGIDEALLYLYAMYGEPVPDSLIESNKFRGTGFATNPSNLNDIVNAIALEWIFGIAPTKGVSNYAPSIVEDMKNAGYLSQEDADFWASAGKAALTLPTSFEPVSNEEKNKPIEKLTDLTNFIMGGGNSAGNDVLLTGLALGRAENLSGIVKPESMLPEQVGSKNIGKNTGSTNGTGPTGSSATDWKEGFRGILGKVLNPIDTQQKKADTIWDALVQGIVNNPDGGSVAVNPGPEASILGSKQKTITAANAPGNAGSLSEANRVLESGQPLMDTNDLANYAANNAARQINNRLGQINNAQNHFPNDPNLNNLQNQFPPNQFNNQLNDRFPGDGSGGNGGSGGGSPAPPVTPTPPDTTTCDPTRATLSQQEVTNIADFIGLPLNVSGWTISYFKAQQFLGTTIYLENSRTTQVVDSTIVPNPNSCIWVVYAPTAKEGAYVTDAQSQTGIKFLFRMP